MYLKCTGNRPGNDSIGYYKIVESYRDDNNKVKQKILFNLGPIPHKKANHIKATLEANRNPNLICTSPENVAVKGHKKYLDVVVLYQLLKKWKLLKLFSDFNYVVPMIINHCLDPTSKKGVTEWVTKTILPKLMNINYEKLNPFSIYRELTKLNKLEHKIQKHLLEQIDDNNKAFFYDITSTYFEGECCIICAKGYSRDHRFDKKQVVIALVINTEGYPLYWEVLPGNTQDVTTIVDLADNLRKKLNLKECTLIFDRGMVSEDNLYYLEDKEFQYVTALDRNQIEGLDLFDLSLFKDIDLNKDDLTKQLPGFNKFDNDLYYQEKVKDDDTRCILGFNRSMKKDELKTFRKNIDNVMHFIEEKNKDLAQAKKRRNKKVTARQIDKELKKTGLHKVIKYNLIPKKLKVTRKDGTKRIVHSFEIKTKIDKTAKKEATKAFGLTCFITKLSPEELGIEKVISSYRAKYLIEKCFRIMKDIVKLRPVRLTIEERVKAHVTVCVLSYMLLVTIDVKIKKSDLEFSVTETLEKLSDCMVDRIKIKDEIEKQEIVTENITIPTSIQKEILKNLECKKVVRKSFYKKYLDIARNEVN